MRIVEADDPVIAISSHANPGLSLWGSALDALSAAWNVALTDCELHPLLVVAGSIGTYHLRCGAKQQLLVTRIPGALSISRTGDEPERVMGDAFWTLFGSLAALELKACWTTPTSMAMTKLGGARGHVPGDLVRVLLESVRKWLEVSRAMSIVRLFVPEREDAESIAEQLGTILGRTRLEVAKSQLLVALVGDIVTDIPKIRNPNVAAVARELAHWLHPKQIVVSVIATVSRRLVEAAVSVLLDDAQLTKSGPLFKQLQTLSNANVVALWTTAYFDALRHFGKESVHDHSADGPPPGKFGERDTVALLAALQRVIAIWLDLEQRRPSLVGQSAP